MGIYYKNEINFINIQIFLILMESCIITTSACPLYGIEFDEYNMTTVEIILKYGYSVEIHTTESEDGYILKLYRIPHGRNTTNVGYPVLVAHGMLTDSSSFVLYGENSLAFSLADEGYDVWLVNMRGTYYSRTHKYLSSKSDKFWDFSWHEYGVYDLPAHIDFIRKHTKHQDLLFLGYSMGTTSFFVLASEKPEYGRLIRGAVLLAPMTTLKYNKYTIRFFIVFRHLLKFLFDKHKLREIFRQTPAFLEFSRKVCNTTIIQRKVCMNVLYIIFGRDSKGTDERALLNLLSHLSDTSTKTVIHYLQVMKSGKFQLYDYGPKRNLMKYGRLLPPEYNLWSITTPTYFFVGRNDLVANTKHVMKTLAPLPSVKDIYFVPNKYFNHIDFMMGKNVKENVYYEIARRFRSIIN